MQDRLLLFAEIVPSMHDDLLHNIALLVPEVVAAVKESNSKTRSVAFDILIIMAARMKRGGTIQHALLQNEAGPSTSSEEASDARVAASLSEFGTILAAGLVGSTPHFVAASLLALGRILFEYQRQCASRATNL